MILRSVEPAICAAHHEVLLAGADQLATHHPRQRRPADDRQDDGDAEVHAQRRPVHRHRRRQRHPQRDGGYRQQKLDGALNGIVDAAAVEPRQPAQNAAEHEAHRHSDQADRQRDAATVQGAREQVAAQLVAAEQQQQARLGHADQVAVAGKSAPTAGTARRARTGAPGSARSHPRCTPCGTTPDRAPAPGRTRTAAAGARRRRPRGPAPAGRTRTP